MYVYKLYMTWKVPMASDRQFICRITAIFEVFTLPHSFRPKTSGSERFRSETLISARNAASVKSEPIFEIARNFFRAYSDQFRATGRNHSDMIRTYSEQIPSKFRSYPSVLIRAIPNKDQ